MIDLASELKKVAVMVEDILLEDDFPDAIEPDFLRDAVCDYPLRGGKRVRPALACWCCGCAGGDPDDARYIACAVEIWHNWTLVHDDIIDGDELRRGKPSAHVMLAGIGRERFGLDEATAERFGRDFAILAGDLAQSRAFNMLRRSREYIDEAAMRRVSAMMLKLGAVGVSSGEALDVLAGYRREADRKTLERIIARKTSDLIEFAAAAGAVAGGADTVMTENFAVFARKMGEAFQLRDDVLGVYGEVGRLGKPIGSDWREGKPTLLRLEALQRATAAQRKLLDELWMLDDYDDSAIGALREVLTATGARAAIDARIAADGDASLAALERCPDNRFREILAALSAYLLDRDL